MQQNLSNNAQPTGTQVHSKYTYNDRRLLHDAISKLESKDLMDIVTIIQTHEPLNAGEEIEIDLDKLRDVTIDSLFKYLKKFKGK